MTGVIAHGFKAAEWEASKHEACAVLIRVAERRTTITYTDLVKQIKSITIEAHDARLPMLLEEISVFEDNAGRGLLTVLVVNKVDGYPGEGFFKMAKERGRKSSDKTKLWIEESKRVYKFWSGKNS